jgi:hypothetical protein
MTGRVGAALTAAVVMAAVPGVASAQGGGTAPGYPGNTLVLERSEPLVAGTVATVKMRGHAEWDEPTDASTIGYDLSIYAQDADVHPTCEVSLNAQRQKSINLPGLSASQSISGWVMEGDLSIQPSPPATGVDWQGESLPFAIRPGVRNLLLCGFQRWIIDDAAWYTLPLRVRQPSCRLLRRSVRRGARVRLKCNLSGRVTVLLRRRGTRPRRRTVTVRSKDGTGRLRTGGLRRGSYRVTMTSGEIRLGPRRRLRIR